MTDLVLAADFPPATREDWLSRVAAVLKGADYAERLVWSSADGRRYEPLYGQAAGPRAARGGPAPWTLFQRADHPDAAKANAQALDDLNNGANGLVLVSKGAATARGYGFDAARIARVLRDVQLHAISLRVKGEGSDALAAMVEKLPLDPSRLAIAFAAPGPAWRKDCMRRVSVGRWWRPTAGFGTKGG